MAEPFKNVFNPGLVRAMGGHFARQAPGFPASRFNNLASRGLQPLEFKQRSDHITDALEACLPEDFRAACRVLLGALHPQEDVDMSSLTTDTQGIRGWGIIPMTTFVARRGLDDFDFGMDVLKEMTKRSSSEFAVRAFLKADPDRAMGHVRAWAADRNFHVRRLASEGIRPRLPWGMRLQVFVEDPSSILPVLETLRDDPRDYVRRSVANNLNDIAKDHPDRVVAIARDWLAGDIGPDRRRLVRHACRTLVKSGHRQTLDALGYGPPSVLLKALDLDGETVEFGQNLFFSADLQSTGSSPQDLIVDYVIHHQKASGTTSPKVFKWTTLRLAAAENTRLTRKHAFRPVTTRVYHGGHHRIEIQANGESLGARHFTLVMPK